VARIKDLIAAVVATGDGFDDAVNAIASVGENVSLLSGIVLHAGLGDLASPQDRRMIENMAQQNVAYKKISIEPGMIKRVQKFLHELQRRDELYYPFAITERNMLLISAVDYDLMRAIAREQAEEEQRGQIIPTDTIMQLIKF